MNKKNILISFVLFSFISFTLMQYLSFNDKKMQVIFCFVGLGDAIIIKTPNGQVLLKDGDPDASVLSCLSKYLPFWHRQIDSPILTHPHADHLSGLLDVLDSYNVSLFITEQLTNKTTGYTTLVKKLSEHGIKADTVVAGATFTTNSVSFIIDGPTCEFLAIGSHTGDITDSSDLTSLLVHVVYKNFSILLTDDTQTKALEEVLSLGNFPHATVLQVPHHGSATGLDIQSLETVYPQISVISVGSNNRYHCLMQK